MAALAARAMPISLSLGSVVLVIVEQRELMASVCVLEDTSLLTGLDLTHENARCTKATSLLLDYNAFGLSRAISP